MLTVPETLDGLFRERVRATPHAAAYRHFDRDSKAWIDLSWRQMDERVARLRAALGSERLAPGARVALMLDNGPDWIALDQAALSLGLVTVPLYVDDRAENLAHILGETEARLLILQDGMQWRRLAPALAEDACRALRRIITITPVEAEDARVVPLEAWCDLAAEPAPLPAHGEATNTSEVVIANEVKPSSTLAEPAAHGSPRPATLRSRDDGCTRRAPTRPDDLASIVYTSGTTGRPKGVMLSHANILSNARAAASLVDIGPDDRFLSFLPLSHMLERTAGYVLPMLRGASVTFARSIQQLGEDLQSQQPTVLISVPRVYERVARRIQSGLADRGPLARALFRRAVDAGWRAFEHAQGRARWHPSLLLHPLLQRLVGRPVLQRLGGRMRLAICGGAPLAPDIARLFIGLGLPLLQGYGLTETSPVISVNQPGDNLPASVGHALPGTEVRLGEMDELQVRGPGVMLGYWLNEAATRALYTPDGWLRTGDRARIDEAGHIFITGRLKDILVLTSGEKVPPADMELALLGDPLFEQVMVMGEGRPHLALLAVLAREEREPLIRAAGLDPASPDALRDRRLEKAVLARANRAIAAFPGYAKLRRAVLIEHSWTIEDGLMTPTLKLKRPAIMARHAGDIDAVYAAHD